MQKTYYSIIPAEVKYDELLSPNAKLLFGEIASLCNERGYCWAGNAYFADLYKVSKDSVSRWIGELVKQDYIETEDVEGGRQICLGVSAKMPRGVGKNAEGVGVKKTNNTAQPQSGTATDVSPNSKDNSKDNKGSLPSKLLHSEEDISITQTDEDGNELGTRKKSGKARSPAADRVAGYYNKKAQEYTGKPVLGFAYSIVKKLMAEKKLTEEFLKEVVDEFFESMPPDDKAVNPYICFSTQSINRKLLS